MKYRGIIFDLDGVIRLNPDATFMPVYQEIQNIIKNIWEASACIGRE